MPLNQTYFVIYIYLIIDCYNQNVLLVNMHFDHILSDPHSNLGHGGPRALQSNHEPLLSTSARCYPCL